MNVTQYDRWARQKELLNKHGLAKLRSLYLREDEEEGDDEAYECSTHIREPHADAVTALTFNHCDDDNGNIFATAGKDIVMIYDDDYLGGYVSIIFQHVNRATEYTPGGHVRCASFLRSKGASRHPSDCWLAFGGKDGTVSVISLAESTIRFLLRDHGAKEVLDVTGSSGCGGAMATLDEGGTLLVWSLPNKTPVASLRNEAAACLALDHQGQVLYAGTRKGEVHAYPIGHLTQRRNKRKAEAQEGGAGAGPAAPQEPTRVRIDPPGEGHGAQIDCMRCLADGRLITKSVDGKVCVWRPVATASDLAGASPAKLKLEVTIRVPNCRPSGQRSVFGTTKDGSYLAVGNDEGKAFIFDVASGEQRFSITSQKGGKVAGCAISEDLSHFFVAMGAGNIYRFDAKPLEDDEEEAREEVGATTPAQAERPSLPEGGAGDLTGGLRGLGDLPLISPGLNGLLTNTDQLPDISPGAFLIPNLGNGMSPETAALFKQMGGDAME